MEDDPNFYRTTTSLEPEEPTTTSGGGGGEWIWIILFLIAILAIIGLVIWLIFSYRRDTKGKTLQLTDPIVDVTSNTQITGKWKSTGNASDKVTLYATLDPPIYNDNGTLGNTGAQSTSASGEAASVSVNGLQKGLKYYATLILTNTNTTNYQVYNQIVFMQDKDIPTNVTSSPEEGSTQNTFSIDDILQVGKIEIINPTGDAPYDAQFNQIPTDVNSLWFYNSQGKIQSANEALDDICLFNSSGKLIAQGCTAGSNSDSQWTYNPTGNANKWCLTSTATNANPTCMILGTINTKGTSPVTVSNTSTVGDAWALAFQNLN
jgi:flagellar basal body-associated protein FliL